MVSAMSFFVALGLIGEAFYFHSQTPLLDANVSDVRQVKNFAGTLFSTLVASAVVSLLVAICGFTCLCKPCKQNRTFVVIFGFLLTALWLVFGCLGAVITAVGTSGTETLQAICDGHISPDKVQFIHEALYEVDTELASHINTYMCSQACPCQADGDEWLAVNEGDWNYLNRTKEPGEDFADSRGMIRLVFGE